MDKNFLEKKTLFVILGYANFRMGYFKNYADNFWKFSNEYTSEHKPVENVITHSQQLV
jgi:hypothetical protein